MTNQNKIWSDFSKEVENHIENYVVPQYGDAPDDQIADYELADYKSNLNRYVGRIGRGSRGKQEEIRDCLKIAHYASRLHNLLLKSENCNE